jgi:MarR family transcriptional regulator, temperature-dependent positive regulator of motility
MHEPLNVRADYIDMQFAATAERTREIGSLTYENYCGVSLRDLTVLRLIGNAPGITMGELVQAVSIEKTIVSKLVSALVNDGLVIRQVGIEDARQIHLSLTVKGITLVTEAVPLGQALESRFLARLTEDEVQTLRRILQKLDGTDVGRDQGTTFSSK